MANLNHLIRDAGYEVLYLLAGYAAVAVRPTLHNAARIGDWAEEHRGRRNQLKHLIENGLVKASESKAGEILRLTEIGQRVLAGGRDPFSTPPTATTTRSQSVSPGRFSGAHRRPSDSNNSCGRTAGNGGRP